MWKPLNLSAEDYMKVRTGTDSEESVAETDGIVSDRAGNPEQDIILPEKESFDDNGKNEETEKEVSCKINEKKNKNQFSAEYSEDTDYISKGETRRDGEIQQTEKRLQEAYGYGFLENSGDTGDGREKDDGDEDSAGATGAFVNVALKSREQARRDALNERKHVIETKNFTAVPENPDTLGNVNVRVVRPVFKIDLKKDDEIIEISQGYGDSMTDGEIFDPSQYEMSDSGFRDIFSDKKDRKQEEKQAGSGSGSRTRRIALRVLKEAAVFLMIFVLSVVLVGTFNVYVRRSNVVVGSSMEPTLYEGYSVYSSLLPYVFGEPEIGDIVIVDITMKDKKVTYFHLLADVMKNNRLTRALKKDAEEDLDVCWVKRVVGVAGDVIEFRSDGFYRNGEPVREDYLKSTANYNYPVGTDPIKVPDGCVFVMGDNRGVSRDSRAIGCISVDIIIGKMTSYDDNGAETGR